MIDIKLVKSSSVKNAVFIFILFSIENSPHLLCCVQLRWVLLLRVPRLLLRGMLSYSYVAFKGIVSRDFRGLQMILINRTWVPNIPLEVYYFFIHTFL